MNALLDGKDFENARRRVTPVLHRTPVLSFRTLGDRIGAPVWLKCENLQKTGSFKVRGALNSIACLTDRERARGVVTISAGNHAQAVAWAARAFGVPARIVMPVDAPDVKREATIALGAEVELEGTTSAERKARAEQIQREVGGTMVPPFDDPDIIAGQGTVALEIIEQLGSREPGMVLAPIGGGGQLSGVAAAVRRRCPEAEVIGVEPEGGLDAALARARRARHARPRVHGRRRPQAGPPRRPHVRPRP